MYFVYSKYILLNRLIHFSRTKILYLNLIFAQFNKTLFNDLHFFNIMMILSSGDKFIKRQ